MAFNSKQYNFSQVSVNILGRTINGFLGIKYSIKTEKDYLFGRGNNPLSIQSGNNKYEGELSLTQSELEAMNIAVKQANPDGLLTQVAFDIVVAYASDTIITVDVIEGAEFTEYEKGMKQGDKNMEISLKFMALRIREDI
jgi:hypothetical protein